ncbi:ParB N-terminal domain-containing protein [Sphingosinicella sp. BN140058]|uniref:ParB/RepB/Spo0J family partition protein n=1 Tax=Sphingosinicella sp. BN140058 TaxID=1892855 RepID=UPI0010135A84|nr:ParB N-terminal domain-containing protein [Sphingosinicella sp. BN140058]QAY80173.1 hypothetical protein ETR14_26380 [Sphingosinicella sp. BN140058]
MTKSKNPVLASAEEERIPLSLLVEWPDNPRKTRLEADVDKIAHSSASRGQLVPLLGWRAAGDTETMVIDGETRRCGYLKNAAAGIITAEKAYRVLVFPPETTRDQLISIALAANTDRQAMNPIEEMEAYTALARAGMKIKAIAEMRGVEQREIHQRLALGDLIPAARDLIRSGTRQMGWAQAMTLGSPAAQERIVNEIIANPTSYPTGAAVRAELTRGVIPAKSARFPLTELADCLVRDLFEDGDHFSDPDKFWARQKIEIDAIIADLRTSHNDVVFIDRMRFDDAGWTAGGDEADATAVVIAHDDGSVEIRRGLIPPVIATDEDGEGAFLVGADADYASEHDAFASEAPTAVRPVAANDTGSTATAPPPPKVDLNPLDNPTKETMTYLIGQVSASLKLQVASNPRLAMAAVIAGSLTKRGPTSPSLSVTGLHLDPKDQTSQVFGQLQAKRSARDRIVLEAGIAGMNSPATVIQKLLALDAGLLEQVFAYTVADSVTGAVDEPTIEIFDAIGADVLTGWRVEETYISKLSNAQKRALALEIIDLQNQPGPRSSPGEVTKAILEAVDADALAGNFLNAGGFVPPQIQAVLNKLAAKRAAQEAAVDAALPKAA